jgi:thioredoxin-related protein
MKSVKKLIFFLLIITSFFNSAKSADQRLQKVYTKQCQKRDLKLLLPETKRRAPHVPEARAIDAIKEYTRKKINTGFSEKKCPECRIQFKNRTDLNKHIQEHLKGTISVCNVCTEIFEDFSIYQSHMLGHLADSF